MNVLQAIGNTPLVELVNLNPNPNTNCGINSNPLSNTCAGSNRGYHRYTAKP